MVTVRELSYDIADVIAMHHLLHYLKNGETQATRFVSGAVAAGLGFTYGPRIHGFLKELPSREFPDLMNKDVLQTLAYAAAGSAAGYFLGQKFAPDALPNLDARVHTLLDRASAAEQRPKHELLELGLTVGSIGWLGYSLTHRDGEEDRARQWWGLGGATLGYLFGPELLKKAKDIVVPNGTRAEIMRMYARGGTIAGGLVGAGISILKRRHDNGLPNGADATR